MYTIVAHFNDVDIIVAHFNIVDIIVAHFNDEDIIVAHFNNVDICDADEGGRPDGRHEWPRIRSRVPE